MDLIKVFVNDVYRRRLKHTTCFIACVEVTASAINLITGDKQESHQHQQIIQDVYSVLQKCTTEWLIGSLPDVFSPSYTLMKGDLDKIYEEIKVLLKYMNFC